MSVCVCVCVCVCICVCVLCVCMSVCVCVSYTRTYISLIFHCKDLNEQNKALRCDVDTVTAEKISLQELYNSEIQKWKETASENKRECTVLSERVAQQEMEIADLSNELLVWVSVRERMCT